MNAGAINESLRTDVETHLEKNDAGSYKKLLPRYKSSIIQDFESFLRSEAELVDDNINLILDEHNSNFINYETTPGLYSIKDLSQVLLRDLRNDNNDNSHSITIEIDDITMKTKLVLDTKIIAISIDDKSFFSTILGFTPHGIINTIMDTLVK